MSDGWKTQTNPLVQIYVSEAETDTFMDVMGERCHLLVESWSWSHVLLNREKENGLNSHQPRHLNEAGSTGPDRTGPDQTGLSFGFVPSCCDPF